MEFASCGSNQSSQTFEVINRGTAAVTLSDLTVKFWVMDTTGQNLAGESYYGGCFGPNCTAVSGVGVSTLRFSPACGPDPGHQANWEATVFNNDGRLLGAGVTWRNFQTALHLSSWGNFNNQAVWYSPCGVGNGNTYTNDLHYALYLRGNLVAASGGVPPSCRPLPTCTPGSGAEPALALAVSQKESPTPERGGVAVTAAPNVSRNGAPVRFKVSLAEASRVTLTLCALTGEAVYRKTMEGTAGENTVTWDLRNLEGAPVASGLYLYRLEAQGAGVDWVRTGKVAVLR